VLAPALFRESEPAGAVIGPQALAYVQLDEVLRHELHAVLLEVVDRLAEGDAIRRAVEHRVGHGGPHWVAAASGSDSTNSAPRPGPSLAAVTSPPCSSARRVAIVRPPP